MKLLVSPHNDDAVLFACFSVQHERPLVLTVFDSYVQVDRGHTGCDYKTRRAEDEHAIQDVLGCKVVFGGVPDNLTDEATRPLVRDVLARFERADEVWLPEIEKDGHAQHNMVGEVGREIFVGTGTKIKHYLTYTRMNGKSIGNPNMKVFHTGAQVLKKLQAMTCYKSQLLTDALGCVPHFTRSLDEYIL